MVFNCFSSPVYETLSQNADGVEVLLLILPSVTSEAIYSSQSSNLGPEADMMASIVCYNVIYHHDRPSGTQQSAPKCSIQYL